ncbi:MAG: hypothetical protein IPO27_12260 [Bacteroidetes bacterium]|nr:hypothetical protein [Bacteroidota bacterium]
MIKMFTCTLLIICSYSVTFAQQKSVKKDGFETTSILRINGNEINATISEFFTNSLDNVSYKKVRADLPSLSPKIYKVEPSRNGYIKVFHNPDLQSIDLLQMFRMFGLNYAYVDRKTNMEIYIDGEGRLTHK